MVSEIMVYHGILLFQFLENMQLKYNKKAKEAGVYIVGACGFDSIPADMGVIFARDQFDGEFVNIIMPQTIT